MERAATLVELLYTRILLGDLIARAIPGAVLWLAVAVAASGKPFNQVLLDATAFQPGMVILLLVAASWITGFAVELVARRVTGELTPAWSTYWRQVAERRGSSEAPNQILLERAHAVRNGSANLAVALTALAVGTVVAWAHPGNPAWREWWWIEPALVGVVAVLLLVVHAHARRSETALVEQLLDLRPPPSATSSTP